MASTLDKAMNGMREFESLIDFAEFFITTKRRELSPKTFNLYRSALIKHFNDDVFSEKLLSVSPRKKSDAEKKTSAFRVKGMKTTDMEKLRITNNKSRSMYSPLINAYLNAVPVTGLRPKEWLTAKISGDFLIVKNIKKKSQYQFAVVNEYNYRLIPINQLNIVERESVHYLIDYYSEMEEGNWLKHYENFRNAFKRLTLYSGVYDSSSIISLYTLRHQFGSNLKASGVSENLICYLLGHSTPRTAKEHYGKVKFGESKFDYGVFICDEIKIMSAKLGLDFPFHLLS